MLARTTRTTQKRNGWLTGLGRRGLDVGERGQRGICVGLHEGMAVTGSADGAGTRSTSRLPCSAQTVGAVRHGGQRGGGCGGGGIALAVGGGEDAQGWGEERGGRWGRDEGVRRSRHDPGVPPHSATPAPRGGAMQQRRGAWRGNGCTRTTETGGKARRMGDREEKKGEEGDPQSGRLAEDMDIAFCIVPTVNWIRSQHKTRATTRTTNTQRKRTPRTMGRRKALHILRATGKRTRARSRQRRAGRSRRQKRCWLRLGRRLAVKKQPRASTPRVRGGGERQGKREFSSSTRETTAGKNRQHQDTSCRSSAGRNTQARCAGEVAWLLAGPDVHMQHNKYPVPRICSTYEPKIWCQMRGRRVNGGPAETRRSKNTPAAARRSSIHRPGWCAPDAQMHHTCSEAHSRRKEAHMQGAGEWVRRSRRAAELIDLVPVAGCVEDRPIPVESSVCGLHGGLLGRASVRSSRNSQYEAAVFNFHKQIYRAKTPRRPIGELEYRHQSGQFECTPPI
ncbi:hypothetical protein C8J57DRAFT_1235132 [Mycena rebaudengoi]|nr:hypothetical protein C8J57DRAFT_1235132 [Mycena rebaudengoi]